MVRPGLLILIALLLTGCGPKPEQIGVTAMTGAVLYLAVSVVAIRYTGWLSRRIRRLHRSPTPPMSSRHWALAGLHAAVSLWAVLDGRHLPDPQIALLAVGASHLSLSLVLGRFSQRHPVTAASIASLVVLPPAALLVITESGDLVEPVTLLWLLTGYMGAVPTAIFVALMGEAIIRRRLTPEAEPVAAVFD